MQQSNSQILKRLEKWFENSGDFSTRDNIGLALFYSIKWLTTLIIVMLRYLNMRATKSIKTLKFVKTMYEGTNHKDWSNKSISSTPRSCKGESYEELIQILEDEKKLNEKLDNQNSMSKSYINLIKTRTDGNQNFKIYFYFK